VTDPIAEALDRFVPAFPSAEGDWQAILRAAAAPASGRKIPSRRSVRRSGFWRRVPARVALVAAVVILAAVVTAVAFGLPQRIVDFFSSAPAPTGIKNFMGSMGVGAPPGMNPRAIPGQTRKIAGVPLYVAPTKSGGFCYLWAGAGGCVGSRDGTPAKPIHPGYGPLGVDVNDSFVHGWVRSGDTRTLEARFADGTTATIPARDVTWVSAPINAGFVAYTVPRSHRDRAHALRSVVALDADGRVIGRLVFPPPRPKPVSHMVVRPLPDGTRALFPRDAEAARARKIIGFRATDPFVAPGRPAHRSRVYLWLVPLSGGGDCFVSNGARGMGVPPTVCAIPRLVEKYSLANQASSRPASNSVLDGGLEPGSRMDLFFLAKPAVATVELRYQDGERERLTPIDGFVLHDITPAHWKPGARLVAAVALNRHGKAISTVPFQAQEPDIYPCKKPINRGHGVKECP
jgi:hypothetical protein